MAILSDKIISSQIYEDTAQVTVPDLVDEYWLGARHNGNLIGCYRVHTMGAVLWQIHARILPKFRRYSEKASRAVLEWCALNIRNFETMMCYVPVGHENVKNHAIAVGFEQVGHMPLSYLKNSKLVGQDILAVSKEKILCQQQQ